ncbi:MAG: helix-turn-helix domain-containing protein, partial [Paramuribaculum sp.]
ISHLFALLLMMRVGTGSIHADTPVKRISQYLATLKDNPDDISALIGAGRIYLDMYDYDGCMSMGHRLENIGCGCPDSISARFYAKLLQGLAYARKCNGREAVSQLSRAVIIAENNMMEVEQAEASNELGLCYICFDIDFGLGLDSFNAALKAARKSGSQQLTADILCNISDAYLWRHDFSGIGFVEEALNISRNIGDNRSIQRCALALAHYSCYNYKYCGDIPALLRKVRDMQLAHGYLSEGEIELVEGRYLISKEDYSGAVSLFEKVLDKGLSETSPLLSIKMLLYKGHALTALDNHSGAIATYREALRIIAATGYNAYRFEAYSGTSFCYERLGDYHNALEFLQNYQRSIDSLWLSEQVVKLHRYRLENESLLNTSRLERQKVELDIRQKYIIILVAIGVVMFAVICLLWHLYRRKESLIRMIVAREKEAMVRERLLRQALDQARAESAEAGKSCSCTAVIAKDKIEDLMVRFNELMSERKAYTDPGISIRSIAEELHTNRTYLSQAINRTFGKSFPQVLAEHRVRAAIEMISDPECDMPLKAIAADVGFSSSSVFFTTFRNIVGMTPAVYRKGQTQIGSDCEGEEL